jgi:hypothetical protein
MSDDAVSMKPKYRPTWTSTSITETATPAIATAKRRRS